MRRPRYIKVIIFAIPGPCLREELWASILSPVVERNLRVGAGAQIRLSRGARIRNESPAITKRCARSFRIKHNGGLG